MKIFVTGKFGTGKSTLLNGLYGGRIEAEIGVGSPHIDFYTFEMASGSLTVSISSQTALTGGLPSSKPRLCAWMDH